MLEAKAHVTGDLTPELSIVMPCLNEAQTVGTCVQKALAYLEMYNVQGEVIVADNGSSDGSQAIAAGLGARVVPVSSRGYGNALRAGIKEARGRFVIMGDSDDSYDFLGLQPFLEKLRDGYDLVLGNRFRGGIAPGAMPPLHRFFGNPFLTLVGRTSYGAQPGFLLRAARLSAGRGLVARAGCGGDGICPRNDRESEHSRICGSQRCRPAWRSMAVGGLLTCAAGATGGAAFGFSCYSARARCFSIRAPRFFCSVCWLR